MQRTAVRLATREYTTQFRTRDYSRDAPIDVEHGLDTRRGMGVAKTSADRGGFAILKKILNTYRSRNLSKRAVSVQWKWDWYQVGFSLKIFQHEREGVKITSDVIESMMTRDALKWVTVRRSVRPSLDAVLDQVQTALRAVKEKRLDEHLGFKIVEKESTLKEVNRSFANGRGVFAEGDISQGAIVGLMPCMAYEGMHKATREWPTDSEGNPVKFSPYIHWRRARLDNSILDADLKRYHRDFGPNATDDEMKKAFLEYELNCTSFMDNHRAKSKNKATNIWYERWMPLYWYFWHRCSFNAGRVPYLPNNRWAARHGMKAIIAKRWDHGFSRIRHINHCGREHDPNILYVPISIPVTFPADLLPYVPVKVDPWPTYGHSGNSALISKGGAERDRMMSRLIVNNHMNFGTRYDSSEGSQFLYMAPCLAAIATRPIADGEELFTNYRFNPHYLVRDQHPIWYERHEEAMHCEDYLANNIYNPRTSFLTRLVGIFDPRISVSDAWQDPRLFDTDIMAWVMKLLRKV